MSGLSFDFVRKTKEEKCSYGSWTDNTSDMKNDM